MIDSARSKGGETSSARGGRGKQPYAHRLRRLRTDALGPQEAAQMRREAALDCGWGRLIFGQTFDSPAALAETLLEEVPERRDIAVYVRDPHLVLAAAPQDLFLDPSHTYRLDLATYRAAPETPRGFVVRLLSSAADADAMNRIYLSHGMVPMPQDFAAAQRDNRALIYFVAEDEASGAVIGSVTGVDHRHAFGDPQGGASLWCLAVDMQAAQPGIGEAMVRRLVEYLQARGAQHVDLSVMHDNQRAIDLYEMLGFERISAFTIKRKNPINETLFAGSSPGDELNAYARIIVKEALRRGIQVELIDAPGGLFRLTWGARSVRCRESLSELTSGVALSICDDKSVTRRIVGRAGVQVPDQAVFESNAQLRRFLARHGSIVVKPARGEQGQGVAVGLTDFDEARAAVDRARALCDCVLLEQCVAGEDLRLVVIGYKVVAAALRRPAQVTGDGRASVRTLVERQSRRRAAATEGESRIELDEETRRCVESAGYALDDVLPSGESIRVRRAANLHTGGTIHDVTDEVHPVLVDAAIRAARAIGIPVTGIDLIVRSPRTPTYAFIEANERPGLANHEPQPTAERFVDLLFPLSVPAAQRRAFNREENRT